MAAKRLNIYLVERTDDNIKSGEIVSSVVICAVRDDAREFAVDALIGSAEYPANRAIWFETSTTIHQIGTAMPAARGQVVLSRRVL